MNKARQDYYSDLISNKGIGSKNKNAKKVEKQFYDHLTVAVCKKRLEKKLIFEKIEHFENGQNWPQYKGYSPCKILTLKQKLKLPKTCKKRLYKHIRVVLCKKGLQKTAKIRKMRAF